MLTALFTEILKLRRSLVLLLCAAAPAMVALLVAVVLVDRGNVTDWQIFVMGGAGLWAFFMLPMTVTALTVLVAQMEHGPKFWNHLLALPVPRWQLFLAKAVVVLLLVGAMMGLLGLLVPLGGHVAEAITPGQQLKGQLDLQAYGRLLATMFEGSILLVAIQLWAALRFRSFVPPLVIGIGGTFVAVAATSAKQGIYFPWLIPTNALATDPSRGALAISIGFFGGLAALVLMTLDLNRKSFA